MRHVRALAGLLAVGVGVATVTAFLDGPGAPAPRSPGDASSTLSPRLDAAYSSAKPDGEPTRTVVYRGVRIPVPAGWRVYRLDRDPTRCLRYDRRAIYIGSPGVQSDCPARLVGSEDVLQVVPERSGQGGRRAVVKAAKLSRYSVRATTDHQVRLPVPEAGVTIKGRYSDDPSGIQTLIRNTMLSQIWPADDDPLPDEEDDDTDDTETSDDDQTEPEDQPAAHGRAWVKGRGFDTCTAPSLSAMRAWRGSYKVSNIYIGGAARACAQPNLTRHWVSSVRRMGYRLVPTYVGLQAPCGRYKPRFTARNAAREGKKAAVDAVRRAKALGIPKGKPIYYDMEGYRPGKSCRKAVMTFLSNWTVKLKALRYMPGVYGSVGSVVRDLVVSKNVRRPTALWFAHWDGKRALYNHPLIPDELWRPHRRIKQYRGGHKETHGGVTINIDSNQVDGQVY